MSNLPPNDWRDRTYTPTEYRIIYRITLGVIVTIVLILIGWQLSLKPHNEYWMGLYTNGIFLWITLFIIDTWRVNKERQRQAQESELKRKEDQTRAIEDLRLAKTHEEKQLIVHRMRDMNLLSKAYLSRIELPDIFFGMEDANMQGIRLMQADLSRARLDFVDLRFSVLDGAKLPGAELRHASLHGSWLRHADLTLARLQDALLINCNLRGAVLFCAELENADLRYSNLEDANLEGANLKGANLKGTNLKGVRYSTHTILPNGHSWQPETTMETFTNVKHI